MKNWKNDEEAVEDDDDDGDGKITHSALANEWLVSNTPHILYKNGTENDIRI